jgi:hypothetical protein
LGKDVVWEYCNENKTKQNHNFSTTASGEIFDIIYFPKACWVLSPICRRHKQTTARNGFPKAQLCLCHFQVQKHLLTHWRGYGKAVQGGQSSSTGIFLQGPSISPASLLGFLSGWLTSPLPQIQCEETMSTHPVPQPSCAQLASMALSPVSCPKALSTFPREPAASGSPPCTVRYGQTQHTYMAADRCCSPR